MLFQNILAKVFADQKEKEADAQLQIEMKKICEQMNLQATEKFLTCIEKMFDLIKVKQGVIILGQPFAGKTNAYKVLAAALNEIVAILHKCIVLISITTLIQGDAKNPNSDNQPKITHFEPTVWRVWPYDARMVWRSAAKMLQTNGSFNFNPQV